MKRILHLAMAAVLLAACAQNNKETNPDAHEKKDTTAHAIIKSEVSPYNIADGEYIEKYPDGNIKIKGTLASGMRKGDWYSYYPNGNKQSECRYEDNKKNGKTATYYPNGKIRYIGYYLWDQPSGTWEFYNEDGSLNQTKEYDKK